MKCIRCNKEIQDGEGNLCEDCKKKFELSQSTIQNDNEKKVKVNIFKRFYSNNVKTYLTQKEKVKTLAIVVGIILLLLIIMGALRKNGGSSDIINKVGNLREYGYADKEGGWIYYIAPDEELAKMGIYKIKENGTKKTELNILGNYDVMSLNVYKNYLYFIVQSNSGYSKENDTFDNKIYRMKTDGSDLEAINDNDFHNNCEVIYVLDNSIYYVGTDAKLYKMGLNGKNRTLVSEEVFSVVKPANNYVVTDKYIVFNRDNPNGSESQFTTMIMNKDGKDVKPVAEDEFMQYLDMDENNIYYTDEDNVLCKTAIGSGKKTEMYSTRKIYHLNVRGKYAFFYSYTDSNDVALYRLNINEYEKGAKPIKVLNNTTPCLNIVGDKLYYTDRDETGGFAIKLLDTNDVESSPITIYSYEYSKDEEDEKEVLQSLIEEESENEEDSSTEKDKETNDTSSNTASETTNKTENETENGTVNETVNKSTN